jgi:hypothetical protein
MFLRNNESIKLTENSPVRFNICILRYTVPVRYDTEEEDVTPSLTLHNFAHAKKNQLGSYKIYIHFSYRQIATKHADGYKAKVITDHKEIPSPSKIRYLFRNHKPSSGLNSDFMFSLTFTKLIASLLNDPERIN